MDRLVFDDDAAEHHGETFSDPDPTYGKTNEHLDELARASALMFDSLRGDATEFEQRVSGWAGPAPTVGASNAAGIAEVSGIVGDVAEPGVATAPAKALAVSSLPKSKAAGVYMVIAAACEGSGDEGWVPVAALNGPVAACPFQRIGW